MNIKLKKIIYTLIFFALYAWTGYGGYKYHYQELADKTNKAYDSTLKEYNKRNIEFKKFGFKEPYEIYKQIHKDGPKFGVNWCFPLLPGVLIAKSYYSIGPLWGAGGIKIVIFYGFGTKELFPISGWIS